MNLATADYNAGIDALTAAYEMTRDEAVSIINGFIEPPQPLLPSISRPPPWSPPIFTGSAASPRLQLLAGRIQPLPSFPRSWPTTGAGERATADTGAREPA